MPAEVPAGVTPTYSQQYRRCGKARCPLCAGGGRGHGPYWYAYWREGGRTRSRYLGKQPPAGGAPPTTAPARPADTVAAQHAPVASPARRRGLRAQTLGGFALWRGDERLDVERWERQKIGALCKWLLSAPGHRLTRDAVVDRFWPEGEPERGMANLRVLVHRLRRVLDDTKSGESPLQYDGELLSLHRGPDQEARWLDAAGFAQAALAALAGQDAAACRAALALYTGDYLPGDAYEDWALARREELRESRLRVLLHLAALCGASGEIEEAERCLRAVLAADPCHEVAALALMRLCAAAGRSGQALRLYTRFAEALHEDLALEPEAETQTLARALAALQSAAPAIPVPDLAPHNLPAPLTSFIGRRRALADLRALLRPAQQAGAGAAGAETLPCRLLTLTGPGGAGKTRLALQLADALLDEPGAYPDGVWLVELASLADPALVPMAVAQALELREEAARPLTETLAAHLTSKRLLLLLDNCEHLVEACAALVARLLPACPGLRVLATSRAALGVAGEQPWPVPALSLPPAEGAAPVGRLLESEAVRLFLERARVQRPDLALTEANAAAVARICRQLEGSPLALELAAARVSVLGLEQIATRLGESIRLLSGGPRSAPARQRTLRATLDWSYQLLGEAERMVFRRLAVFAGGCTLEAAEAVCAGEGIAVEAVLDLVSRLVRHSLVQMEDAAGQARYRLLETVRLYGQEQLEASGEASGVRERHLWWCVALAEGAEPLLRGPEQGQWLARLEAEHDNLRAALTWSIQQRGGPAAGVELAGALWRFWWAHGHLGEGRAWLTLARGIAAPVHWRARVLKGAGNLAASQGDLQQARVLHEEGLALYRELGNKQGIANSLHNLANLARGQGDYQQAELLYEESLALKRELADRWGIASALGGLGNLANDQGDYQRARVLYDESLTLYREVADKRGIGMSLDGLGFLATTQGDYQRARVLYDESLALYRELGNKYLIAIALTGLGYVAYEQEEYAQARALHDESLTLRRELGDKPGIAYSLNNLGAVARLQGDLARARALYEEALALFRELGDQWWLAISLTSLGYLACDQGEHARAALLLQESLALRRDLGDHGSNIVANLEGLARLAAAPGTAPQILERAVRLLGAAAALREAMGAPLPPSQRAGHERATAALRAAVGETDWAAAWAEGQALTLEQAVSLALGAPAAL